MDKAQSKYGCKFLTTQGRKCLIYWHEDISRMIPLVVSEALDMNGLGLVFARLCIVHWGLLQDRCFLMMVQRACVMFVPLISPVIFVTCSFGCSSRRWRKWFGLIVGFVCTLVTL